MTRLPAAFRSLLSIFVSLGVAIVAVAADGWPDVFNPLRVTTLHLAMSAGDWATVQADADFNDPRPAQFWADGETAIAVTVKRKSDPPIGPKVSLKIDINDTVPGQSWRNLKKLSLENGAEGGLVKEGVQWQMHRLASGFYGYPAAQAAWVRLYVNGELIGIYTHAEERDKQMLENRGMWKEGATWLYKNDPNPVLEAAAAPGQSPTYQQLCFSPFGGSCPQTDFESNLVTWIDMQGMLTLGAIEAFAGNRDGLFTHDGKNHFFADFAPHDELKRLYFPWDLDTGLSSTTASILGWAGEYQAQIFGHPWFRQWFLHTMTDLLDGPLSEQSLTTLLNELEPVLTPVLEEDVNSGLEQGVSEHFDSLRRWATNRIANVRAQIGPVIGWPHFTPAGGEIVPGIAVTLSHTNSIGTVYYTLDGRDPRVIGGEPGGMIYSNALILNDTTHVMSRVRVGTNWSALRQATFNVANHAAAMKVTEIHYAPATGSTNDDGGEYEFIELQNISASSVNLSGCYFDGIQYGFRAGTIVAPDHFVVLVRNAVAFTNRYPGVAYHGIYWGGLDSKGETVRLKNSDANNIFSVEYNNEPPWPLGANRFGWSLVNQHPGAAPDNPEHWRASTQVHGSPGANDPTPPYGVGVVINEVLTHTDPPQEDAIELHNPTSEPVDISGWHLSDKINIDDSTGAVLKRYRIPAGTVIPPGAFAMFYEQAFNSSANGTNRFALSSLGEQVYLSSSTTNDELSGYIVGVEFGAVENGISLGRHRTSRGVDFIPLELLTFGTSNAMTLTEFRTGNGASNPGPRQAPVILNEIMYHPAEGVEFIEIYNRSPGDIDLAGWNLNGANFTFPEGTMIGASNFLVLIGTTNLPPSEFRLANSVPFDVPIIPAAFDLNNGGERMTLEKPNPDSPDAPLAVDQVRFNDRSPWPTEGDGAGPSLERIDPDLYGNEPRNWRTLRVGGSPGRPNLGSKVIAIARGSAWRYNELGRDFGGAWQATNYSDSGWSRGVAPLGLNHAATTVFSNAVPGRITTYFRKNFVVHDDAAQITNLVMHVNYDDGFIAYLNGTEISRRSIVDDPVTVSTLAAPHPAGSYETITLDFARSLLRPGANILAVELHQAATDDTNILWDAELSYELGQPTVETTPFRIISIETAPDSTIVQWQSVAGTTYRVQRSADLAQWDDLSDEIVATNSVTGFSLPSLNPAQSFLRIRTVP